jgi:hypothetical protein
MQSKITASVLAFILVASIATFVTLPIQTASANHGTASADTNGIHYKQPDGYTVTYGQEYFGPLDMHSGSQSTIYFKGKNTDSFMMAGYIQLQECQEHDTDTIAFVLGGGPRNTVNPTWADSLDLEVEKLGSDNANGDDIEASRLRVLESFPTYSSGITPGPVTFDFMPNGNDPGATICEVPGLGDLSDDTYPWTGFMAFKLNVDEDENGTPDHVAVQAFADIGGRHFTEEGPGAPINSWSKVFDGYYECDDLDPMKSCFEPYVQTIGQGSETYHSMKINGQSEVPANVFFTLKNITSVEPN